MPILPREIQRKIRENPLPDIVGEEGFLNEAELNHSDYFVKRWNAVHDKGFAELDRHKEGSPLSPYLHKAKFWEYKVINSLFPDRTVRLAGGYDPRITKNEDGTHSFDSSVDKPVTISHAVPKRTEQASRQQARIKEFYAASAPILDQLRARHSEPPEGEPDPLRQQYEDLFTDIDAESREVLNAPEFQFFQTNGTVFLDNEGMEAMLKKLHTDIRRINPNSSILPFLPAGIAPIHPEVNFIPRNNNPDGSTPAGTFIELGIVSPPRLFNYIRRQNNPRVEKATSRMLVYQMLDRIFDTAVRYFITEGKMGLYTPEVQTALFRLTEQYRELATRLGLQVAYNNQEGFTQQILVIFERNQTVEGLVSDLEGLATHLESL